MKVVHVIPSIQAEASGPSYSVTRLCEVASIQGEDVELHTLSPVPEIYFKTYKIHAHPASTLIPRLGISPHMCKALENIAKTAQIMHNHSLWMLPNIYPGKAVNNTKCRLVISPTGTLSEHALNRSKWLKKLVWALAQEDTLKKATCFHATSEKEFHEIRQKGFRAPIAIIPHGIDIPAHQKLLEKTNSIKRLLFLGRIHPIKGIDMLLHAWAELEKQYIEWELHIIGPDNGGYLPQMQALAKKLCVERVVFPGPAYGIEKNQAYSSADLFVLPTYSENFGVAVSEALAHSIPSIVTKGAPWSGLETHGCGWWIDIGREPLIKALREAMSKSTEELTVMGEQGRKWMKRDFSWEQIGEMMHKTYEWVLGGGTPPDWVVTD